MMNHILPELVHMSVIAGVTIVVVCLIRLLLHRAPRLYSYLLWFIVLFRLLCPVAVSSAFSLVGLLSVADLDSIGDHFYNTTEDTMPSMYDVTATGMEERVAMDMREPAGQNPEREILAAGTGGNQQERFVNIGTIIWVSGMIAMLCYGISGLVSLKRKLVGAVESGKHIYRIDHMTTPFVIGIVRPCIYLPSGLSETEREYILLHEKYHIRRGDHIAKIVFYLALCIHWFNPLVWLAFRLFVKDMEMSCDEAVVCRMTADTRSDYAQSLLYLTTGRSRFRGTPLAFGEDNTGERIKNVLHWKKPKLWVAFVSVLVCAVAAVCLMTNPKDEMNANETNSGNGTTGNGINSEEESYSSLEDAIRASIIDYNRQYSVECDFSCASFVELSDMYNYYVDHEENNTTTYYGVALYKDMNLSEEGITELVTTCSPVAITFYTDSQGKYHLKEYLVPGAGGDDAVFTEYNFPGVIVGENINTSLYDTYQCIDCHAQAVAYAGLDTDAIIGGLVEYIASEPLTSSNPEDYIQASPVAYKELTYYGSYTIAYAQQYRASGAEDLNMAILDRAARDIEEALGYHDTESRSEAVQ